MISFITEQSDIISYNIALVLDLIKNYQIYRRYGYTCPLPDGVNPDNPPTETEIRALVSRGIKEDFQDYIALIRRYEEAWNKLLDLGLLDVAVEIYGYKPDIDLAIVPTKYGPGAGQRDSNSPLYVSQKSIDYTGSPEVSLLHEIAAHAWSAKLRDGTPISEEVSTAAHQVKERCMDLITREFGVRLGLGSYDDFRLQEMGMEVADIVDSRFYINPNNPIEGLKHPRDIKGFFDDVLSFL